MRHEQAQHVTFGAAICAGLAVSILSFGAPSINALETERASVTLSFSDAALEHMVKEREGVVIRLSYFVEASPAGATKADWTGMIDLGADQVQVPPIAGQHAVAGDGPAPLDSNFAAGPTLVNVAVYSARLSNEDNILNCDLFEGQLQLLQKSSVEIHCSLLTEDRPTQYKP